MIDHSITVTRSDGDREERMSGLAGGVQSEGKEAIVVD
jgi:hypothetical protein